MYRTLAHGVLVSLSVPGRRGPLHVRYAFSRVDFEVATSTQCTCCCLSWLYLGRATSGGNSEQPSPSLCARLCTRVQPAVPPSVLLLKRAISCLKTLGSISRSSPAPRSWNGTPVTQEHAKDITRCDCAEGALHVAQLEQRGATIRAPGW